MGVKRFSANLDDLGVPYLWLQVTAEPDSAATVDGFLMLDLAEGTTLEDAEAFAKILNGKITEVYISRLADPRHRLVIDGPN